MILEVITAIKEGLHLWRLFLELKLRRQLKDELDKIDDEIDDLEDLLASASDQPELVDRLLGRQADRVRYRAGIHSIGERAAVRSSEGDDPSYRVRDSEEERADSRAATGEQEALERNPVSPQSLSRSQAIMPSVAEVDNESLL